MCFGSVFGQIILIFSFMLCMRPSVQVILETYSNQTHTNISSLVLAAYKKNPPNFKNIKYLSPGNNQGVLPGFFQALEISRGLSRSYPLEISRTWKSPGPGKFQALEASMASEHLHTSYLSFFVRQRILRPLKIVCQKSW